MLEPAVASSIYLRTAGNPFFVRELSRLLADGDDAAGVAAYRANLPSTVVDVVRHRMSGLDEDIKYLLQVAAIIGSDVEIGVLARAVGIDEQTCLDRLESLEGLGLIAAPADPRVVRFAHDIVRESVVESTPRRSVSSMHLRVADALEDGKAADDIAVERFAHHLWAAGPLADPPRTADALICAGRTAAAKSAFEAADRFLQSAAQLARRAGLAEVELSALSHLTAVVGMRSGYVGSGSTCCSGPSSWLARWAGSGRQQTCCSPAGPPTPRASGWIGPHRWRAGYSNRARLPPIRWLRAYGWSAWGIHMWDLGNIGEAFRYLGLANSVILEIVRGPAKTPFGVICNFSGPSCWR